MSAIEEVNRWSHRLEELRQDWKACGNPNGLVKRFLRVPSPLEEEERRALLDDSTYHLEGCLAVLAIKGGFRPEGFYGVAASESRIVEGMATEILTLFQGCSPGLVREWAFPEKLRLPGLHYMTPNRRHTASHLLAEIRRKAGVAV